jgi:hypothetical protein
LAASRQQVRSQDAVAEPEPRSPIDADEDRPWGQPDTLRRDCEPDRGNLLALLSKVALWCGLLSFVLAVPALVGILVGLVALMMARLDLERMEAGDLDPQGRDQAATALWRTEEALALCVLGPFICPLLWAYGYFLVLELLV